MAITADYGIGSSGVPVVNARGELSGVISSPHTIYLGSSKKKERDPQMVMKFCVPLSRLQKLWTP